MKLKDFTGEVKICLYSLAFTGYHRSVRISQLVFFVELSEISKLPLRSRGPLNSASPLKLPHLQPLSHQSPYLVIVECLLYVSQLENYAHNYEIL